MLINKISLFNFRNYRHNEINPVPGINVFWGENGSGKTNILEAIYFIAFTRSFRTINDHVLVNNENDQMQIEIEIYDNSIIKTIVCEYSKSQRKKTVKINNNRIPRISNLIGEIPVILFSPETIQIIKSDPQLRREFLDEFLFIINNNYYDLLLKYQKIISHRNFILKKIKEGKQNKNSLDIWNNQMINSGTNIIQNRIKLINEINNTIINSFTDIPFTIKLNYNSKFFTSFDSDSIKKIYETQLKILLEEEIARGITLIGPHRDDIDIYFEGRSAKLYASEGQQRLISLILKFAQAELLKIKKATEPVILLDDFSSELDEKNRGIIVNLLKNSGQIFITTTSLDNIKNLNIAKKFFIEKGSIIEK